mgnify:CR=1 FL=1
MLGVTATPDRADKKALGEHFDTVAFEITLLDLIHQGFLVPIKARVCDVSINLANVAIRGGDFDAVASGDALEPVGLFHDGHRLKAAFEVVGGV